VLFALVFGTAGYMVLQGWSFVDALYMAVITLSTVGYLEVQPLNEVGRLFTIGVIFVGLLGVFSGLGVLAQVISTGELGDAIRRRRMRQRIRELRDHYIVCGFGRVGRAAAAEFAQSEAPLLVIDTDQQTAVEAEGEGISHLLGDATDDHVLRAAGIDRARGLVAAIGSDATNVYITLSAKSLNPDVFVIARASNPEAVEKLDRAGADRVASPYDSVGRQMAFLALRPAVVEFVDHVTGAPGLRIEEVEVREGSALDGVSLQAASERYDGVTFLALKRTDGGLRASPDAREIFRPGDMVIALGPEDALASLAG
jgi:voltage-gated potassium channel